jgi:hypothetical protein
MEFTKNNYLQGHGHGSDWYVDLSPASRKVKSYYEETVHAMENLYETKTGKFQVLYSGGVDSQYICEVFLKLKMDFDTIIIRLMSNNGEVYNQHDIAYAYEFCAKNNITPIIYDVNFDDFVESGKIVEIAESVNCCSFAVPATFYVANKLDGYSIIAGGDPYIKYNESKNVWLFEELEYAHSSLRYYAKNNLNGSPFILSYTPEMMLSFLLDPKMVALGLGLVPGKTGSNSTKSHVYNNGSGFNIDVYDFVNLIRIKYTGYEKISYSPIIDHPNLKIFEEFKKKWNGEYVEPYHDVVTRLSIHQ